MCYKGSLNSTQAKQGTPGSLYKGGDWGPSEVDSSPAKGLALTMTGQNLLWQGAKKRGRQV